MHPIFVAAQRHFEPRPRSRAIQWLRHNAQTDLGRPYDHAAFPYLGAPGGPCDTLDDPYVRAIGLQWASRCGKTQFGQFALQYLADADPGPMLFVSSVQKLAKEVIDRTYKQIEKNPRLADQLLPEKLRKDEEVVLRDCRIYVGWARSVSALADKRIRYGHANEIDKWKKLSTSGEGDPLNLFSDRFKDYPSHKKIVESTPAVKGRSRIEAFRLSSTNCRFHVPCPHCRRYQTLNFGDGPGAPGAGGVRWKKLPSGKHDKDLARRTAYYQCAHCGEKILDQHRAGMVRRGVWAPEGCGVNDDVAWKLTDVRAGTDGAATQDYLTDRYQWRGWKQASWITGAPVRDGPDAGYQLSSLYALSLGWGDIAAEFVASKDDPGKLQNFINQWLGETWELRSRQQTWEQLGLRIIEPTLRAGVAPEWASLLTLGVDRQADHFVFTADVWGPDRRSATIAYGEASDFDELLVAAVERNWPHADGGPPLAPALVLIDSGFRPDGVYEFAIRCKKQKLPFAVLPCKGSSNSLNADWRLSTLGKDTSAPGTRLIWVDTARTQLWLDRQLHDLSRDAPGGHALYAGTLAEHQDFLEQLLNDAAIATLDSANNAREVWQRIATSIPNDFRDARRYGYVAMLIATRGAAIRDRKRLLAEASRHQQQTPTLTMPDGRPFLITERR